MRMNCQLNPNARLFQVLPCLVEQHLSAEADLPFLKQVLWRTHGLDGAPRATVAQLVDATGATRVRVTQARQQVLSLVGELLNELRAEQHDCHRASEDLRLIESELDSLSDVVATANLEELLEARGGKALNPGWVQLLLRVKGFQPVRLHAARGLKMDPACFRAAALPEKNLQKVVHKLYALEGRASEVRVERFIHELRRAEQVEIAAVQLGALIGNIRSLEIHQGAIRTVTCYLNRPSDRRVRESTARAQEARPSASAFDELVQRSEIVVQRSQPVTNSPMPVPGASPPVAKSHHRPLLGLARAPRGARI